MVFDKPHRFRFEDRPLPEPGPEEVRIRIARIGICGSDLHGYTGESGRRQPGMVMGHEASGWIDELGTEVEGIAVGDLVTFNPTLPCDGSCGHTVSSQCVRLQVIGVTPELQGAFADAISVRADRVVPTEGLSVDQAATVEPMAVGLQASSRVAVRGRIDILVNNSGPFSMDPFSELTEGEWDRIWDSNVKAAYMATQLVVPGMREAGWGRIVNISAGSAYLRNHSIYSLAKEAMITLTEELALELGPEINVNAIAPGQIAESADDIAEFDLTFVARAIEHTPTARLVTRPEVAAIVVALCTPLFDGVTGVTIPVDGGFRLARF